MSASPQPYLSRLVRYWDKDGPGELHRAIDGSMVLVDISGFTKMSERLARSGKVGAEELTIVIGETFGALLPAAYAFGANLLKFGGDALLLLFTGEGHECRACAAALAMQRTLDEVGVCATSAGMVTLRMSVGIHSSKFEFFLVGDSHRELVVAGPAASRTVEMESAASAGQILVSQETAASLPTSNRGRARGPGILLRGHLDADETEYRAATSPTEDLAQFVPVGLCDLLLGGEVEPEHRPATVAFLRFDGFDSLIERQGCDVAAQRLDGLVRAVQGSVDQRGVTFLGTDIAANGGKIILTAGVPSTTGNDEEQMLLALRQVVSGGTDLPISVGVTWGPVFSGEIGTSYRRTYTVMGDTVNLAARLMAKAPIGEIYATSGVLEGSRTTFATTTVPPFMVKGKRLPVEAVSVSDAMGTAHRAAGLPLIGRDKELAHISDAWEKVLSGSGQAVEISADAGMGKSRLLEEFLAISQPPDMVTTECRLYQAATPYFPFRALLRGVWGLGDLGPRASQRALIDLVDAHAPHLAPWLSLIAFPLGVEIPESAEVSQLEDEFRPARTLSAISELLEATVIRPTVLIIEDTHWMDEPSRELLAGLLSGPRHHPWMLVLTRRPGDDGFVVPEDSNVTTIPLEPLGLDEAKTLIYRATEDSPLPPVQVERLAKQAQGRPLFLVELLQTLRTTGSLEEIPQSVEAMIAARIDTLPLSDRNILRRFSVLGAGFQLEQTVAVLGGDVQSRGWQPRTIRRLTDFLSVDSAGWVQFHHALIRDVAYAGLPFRTRQDLHARVGDSIFAGCDGRPEGFSELLSLHYFHAGRWSRSWRFSQMAGDRARDIYANHEAAAFYQRALQSSGRLAWVERPDRARVQTALAKVQYEAGSYRDSVASLRAAIKLVDDPVAEADLRLDLARSHQRMGALSSALRDTALGLKVVDGVDSLEATRASARLRSVRAGLLLDQLRPRMALRVGLQAVEEAEASGDEGALARAYTNIDEAYQILGMRDMAVHEERALEIYEELGDLRNVTVLATNLGVQAYADGQWDDAIALYSKAQEVSQRSGNVTLESAAAANLGEVLISRGLLDEAEAVLEEARRVLRGHDYSFALFAETQLARLKMERGDNRTAIAALTRIIDEAKRTGQPYFGVDASLHLADALTRSGEPGAALEVIGAAKRLAGEDAVLYEVSLDRLRAAALIAMSRPEEALDHLESALASAREQRLLYEQALILMLEAEIGAGNGAFEEAHRLFQDLGASLV